MKDIAKRRKRRRKENKKEGRRRIERPSFRNLPFLSFIPVWVLLEEPRVRRGCVHCTASILYASPTRHHPSQSQPPVHLILAFFVLREPLRPGPSSSFNSCFVYTLVRFRTPPCIRVVPEGSTVDRERERDAERARTKRNEKAEGEQGKYEISRTKGVTAVWT